MTQLGELLTDSHTIGRMTDAESGHYWKALGQAVRIASQATPAPEPQQPAPARTEIDNVAASTERAWTRARQSPATAFGFGHAETVV